MAKRFTDTAKWKDTWFQDLPAKYKLFWIYLLDECDAAGLWKPNIRLATFQIGEPFEEAELKRVFCDRITITESGYWFITKFINFQYGELSESSKPHLSIIKILHSHKIKGYPKGIHTLQEKEKEKDKEKDSGEKEVKEKEGESKSRTKTKTAYRAEDESLPHGGEFPAAWAEWCKHRRESRKPITPTAARQQLSDLGGMDVERAVAAIKHSIAGGYQGIFEPRPANGSPQKPKHAPQHAASGYAWPELL